MMVPGPDQSHENWETYAACDFFELYLDDVEAGIERPLAEYLARFPGHEEVVAREYLSLRAKADAAVPAPSGDRLGPYRLLRPLGSGGQSTVHLAEDTRIGRQVALKVLDGALRAASPAHRERLGREARLLSRLDHPGICGIYEAQLDGERPYLAMRYVEGETLEARLERAGGLPTSVAEIHAWLSCLERVARAAQAAHALGVVHRDIKPANIMLAPDGAPVLLDLGIAVRTEGDTRPVTLPGQVFGTLAYMAPEQLAGVDLDARSDVYALGAVLFECLTRRRPFEAKTREALHHAILAGGPADAADANAALPRDVCVVLATALDRDRARRYATALELAEDLRRIRAYEPIAARPAGTLLRLRRWAQRHPVIATTSAASAVLLGVGLAVTLLLYFRLAARQDELRYMELSHRARTLARTDAGTALNLAIAAAERAPHADTATALLEVVDACWELRGLQLGAGTGGQSPYQARAAMGKPGLLVATNAGAVEVHDPMARTVLHRLPGHVAGATVAAFVREDTAVVSGGADGTLALATLADGRDAWRVRVGDKAVRWLEVSADQAWVAACFEDGGFAVLATADGGGLWHERGHAGATQARFSPDGRWLLTASGQMGSAPPPEPPSLRVWDLAARVLAFRAAEPADWLRWAEWDEVGARFVAACDDGFVRVYDVAPFALRHAWALGERVWWAGFQPHADVVVAATAGALSVYGLDDGALRKRVRGFDDRPPRHAAFAPDGSQLAVVAWDRSLNVFDADDFTLRQRHLGVQGLPERVTWRTPAQIVTCTQGDWVQVWHTRARPSMQVLAGHGDRVSGASFAPDGRRALTASLDGTARVWDLASARTTCVLGALGGAALTDARFSGDGTRVVTGDAVGQVAVWDVLSGARQMSASVGAAEVREARFVDGGATVLGVGSDGSVGAFDARDGVARWTRSLAGAPVVAVALEDQRGWLALGGSDRTVRVLASSTGELRFTSEPWRERAGLDPMVRVFDLAFDAAGTTLLAACEDISLRAWATPTWAPRFEVGAGTAGRVVFDPRGRFVVFGGRWNGAVRRLTLPNLRESWFDAVDEHGNTITALRTSADGRFLLSASKDRTARLWDLDSGRLHVRYVGHTDVVLDAAFDAASERVITASADGTARIWPVSPLALARRAQPRREQAQDDVVQHLARSGR